MHPIRPVLLTLSVSVQGSPPSQYEKRSYFGLHGLQNNDGDFRIRESIVPLGSRLCMAGLVTGGGLGEEWQPGEGKEKRRRRETIRGGGELKWLRAVPPHYGQTMEAEDLAREWTGQQRVAWRQTDDPSKASMAKLIDLGTLAGSTGSGVRS